MHSTLESLLASYKELQSRRKQTRCKTMYEQIAARLSYKQVIYDRVLIKIDEGVLTVKKSGKSIASLVISPQTSPSQPEEIPNGIRLNIIDPDLVHVITIEFDRKEEALKLYDKVYSEIRAHLSDADSAKGGSTPESD